MDRSGFSYFLQHSNVTKFELIFENFPIEKSMKIENFKIVIFFEKIEILKFSIFIDFSIGFFFENKLALFHEKHPSLKINSSELSGRIPFKVGLKWPHELAPGGKTICLI